MGGKKIIIGLFFVGFVVFLLFVVTDNADKALDSLGDFVFDSLAETPEFGANSCLSESRKTNISPQPEDSVTSDVPVDSQDGIVPRFAYFLQTGKMEAIRDLPREDVRIAIEAYVSMQSRDQLAETLHEYLGTPYGLFYSIDDPEDYLMEIADLLCEEVKPSPPLSNLVITDACAEDGSVSGAVHTIPAGSSRIFAVFENSDALQGIDSIYAVWRDLNDDSMTFSEYEPLRRDSKYNYVWLELMDGWSAGSYQLDLADSALPSRILATTKFRVE